jgi:S-adenosylmethionine:tRNA ribosyltransferase-isomerase
MESIKASEFDYALPPELIAQQPRARGRSRLLVLTRATGQITHANIRDLPEFLKPGDCLVVNDSKVLPARLRLQKVETGARVEVLLHREAGDGLWEALARPYRRLRVGTRLRIGTSECEVAHMDGAGRIRIRFASARAGRAAMRRHGEPPLPPYIIRPAGVNWRRDRARYQTIFAAREGSVAAPTAGLHFSPSLLAAAARRGIRTTKITLHVGWGTFAPLPEGDLSAHTLHHEYFSLGPEAADRINSSRRQGGRVVACGTTVARTLESAVRPDGSLDPAAGETSLFIRPGYRWRGVDALLTNFHLPRSSLLMLVCAFAGRDAVLGAYAAAIREKYHFYSYGDAMLLL